MSEFGGLRKHEKTQRALVGLSSAALAAAVRRAQFPERDNNGYKKIYISKVVHRFHSTQLNWLVSLPRCLPQAESATYWTEFNLFSSVQFSSVQFNQIHCNPSQSNVMQCIQLNPIRSDPIRSSPTQTIRSNPAHLIQLIPACAMKWVEWWCFVSSLFSDWLMHISWWYVSSGKSSFLSQEENFR